MTEQKKGGLFDDSGEDEPEYNPTADTQNVPAYPDLSQQNYNNEQYYQGTPETTQQNPYEQYQTPAANMYQADENYEY